MKGGQEVGEREADISAREQMEAVGVSGKKSRGGQRPVSDLSLVDIAVKLTLSWEEASLLSGLAVTHLKDAGKRGQLHVLTVGYGGRIRRTDLNTYISNLK